MLKIHAVQAHEGDSLLLEHTFRNARRFVLVDGGPRKTFDPHLERALKNRVARNGGRIDLAVLSHVDADHVVGLLDLFVDLRSAKDDGDNPLVKITELWHNTFGLLDTDGAIAPRFRNLMVSVQALMSAAGLPGGARRRANVNLATLALASIRQGERLGREARLLRVPTNKRFRGKPLVASGDLRRDTRRVNGLSLRVVGPTKQNIDELRKDWKEWLDEQEDRLRRGQFNLQAMSDKSVPNLSSIQLLVEKGGKTALLTGDGRGDHLIQALKKARLMDANGIDVDLLKVPHHGSDRNVTRKFFEEVRAKTYLISANGKHGNPDYDTLKWIVDTAKRQDRRVTLALTNETSSVKKLRRERPLRSNNYKLKIRSARQHYLSVTV